MARAEHAGENLPPPRISRRKFLIGAGSVAVAGGLASLLGAGRKLFEQETAATTGSNTVLKPKEPGKPIPNAEEKKRRAELLNFKIVGLDGRQNTLEELTSQKPLVIVGWSILDWGSWDLVEMINHRIYPQHKDNPQIQFLALEVWAPVSEVKTFFEKKPDGSNRPGKVSFPVAVAPDYRKSPPLDLPIGSRGVAVIDVGVKSVQIFGGNELFEQVPPAIDKLLAAP